jgi:hypothetical protein
MLVVLTVRVFMHVYPNAIYTLIYLCTNNAKYPNPTPIPTPYTPIPTPYTLYHIPYAYPYTLNPILTHTPTHTHTHSYTHPYPLLHTSLHPPTPQPHTPTGSDKQRSHSDKSHNRRTPLGEMSLFAPGHEPPLRGITPIKPIKPTLDGVFM